MEEIGRTIMSKAYHKDRNCFKLCVIAHGNGDNIYPRKDPEPAWNIQNIRDDLDDVESLLGKPKVLVIDACRGGKLELNFFPFLIYFL